MQLLPKQQDTYTSYVLYTPGVDLRRDGEVAPEVLLGFHPAGPQVLRNPARQVRTEQIDVRHRRERRSRSLSNSRR